MKQFGKIILLAMLLTSCDSKIDQQEKVENYLQAEYDRLLEKEQTGVFEIKQQVARIGNRPEDLAVATSAEMIMDRATELFTLIESDSDLETINQAVNTFDETCQGLECEYRYPVSEPGTVVNSTQAKYKVLRLTQEAMQCLKLWVAATF
jgi:hypothetical protein